MVKRYCLQVDSETESPYGPWLKATDYDALQAKHDNLAWNLDGCMESINNLSAQKDALAAELAASRMATETNFNLYRAGADRIRALETDLAAATAENDRNLTSLSYTRIVALEESLLSANKHWYAANRKIEALKAQDEVHWKTRRSLLAELERCRAANVYDGNAHRKAAELEVAVASIRALEAAPNGIDFLQTWMRTPNPHLGSAVPLDMLYQGYGRRLAQFIDSAYEANSAPEHRAMPRDEADEVTRAALETSAQIGTEHGK